MSKPCRSLPGRLMLAAIGAATLTAGPSAAGDPVQLAHFTLGVPERRELTSEFAWTDAVAEIQGTLYELGFYKGPIDGRLGAETLDAIHTYRRRHGVIDTETTWWGMLTHMRAIGEAMRLQDSLKAARERQVEEAKSKLLGHAAARGLMRDGSFRETADPLHDSSVCLSAPTLRCVIDEVVENIRAVNREKYRNWALQDLIGVLAQAGMVEPMKDAVRRLTDARLILVSLRDGAAAMAGAGRMELAEETIALLPEGRDRMRALTALARGWLVRGERGAAREVADRLVAELGRVGDADAKAQAAAEIATVFARLGDAEQARRLLEAGTGPVERVAATRGPAVRAAAAMVLAELGEPDASAALLAGIPPGSLRRPAEMALVGAFARAGALDRTLETASGIDIARYRVVALCDAARILSDGRRDLASRTLAAAIGHLPEVTGEFATDFAWACIAETHAILGEAAQAEVATGHIEGADLKARTLWRLLALRRAAGDDAGAEALERAATAATETVDTFKRVSILSDVAAAFARSGRAAEARALLDQAIRIVRDVKSRWWRARALSRVAAAMIVLESPTPGR